MTAGIADTGLADDHVAMGIGRRTMPGTEHAHQEVASLLAPPDLRDRIVMKRLVSAVANVEWRETLGPPVVRAIGLTQHIVVGDSDVLVAFDSGVPMAVVDYVMAAGFQHRAEPHDLLRESAHSVFAHRDRVRQPEHVKPRTRLSRVTLGHLFMS